MGLYPFIIIIFMASTQISFTSSNRHSKFINGVPRKPINGHDGVPMPPPRRAIQEITYIAPTTGAGPMQSIVDSSVPPPPGVRWGIGHITPSGAMILGPTYPLDAEPITSSPILGEYVSAPAGGGGTVNWNPNPTDGRDYSERQFAVKKIVPDYSEKQFAVKKSVVIIVAIVAVNAVVIAVLILSCKLMNKEGSTGSEEQFHSTLSTLSVQGASIITDAVLSSKNQQLCVPLKSSPNISSNDIVNIKKYCSESSPIANGSFASVYKMRLGSEILAIKEIKNENGKNWVEDEGNLMMGKEHINVNKLYSWWMEGEKSYLAYKYIDGCTLDDYLRGNESYLAHSWQQRLRMIMGIAKGVEFLHRNEIIHVDIKPQNIMVDSSDNEAKLVDFGFSRHVDWQGTHRSTDKIIGTKGYWAPEYCWKNKLSYKHDVYSFGVVVLEIITGQRHVDQARSSSQFHIPEYVRHMIEKNCFEEAVDSRLKQDRWGVISVKEAFSVAKIALRCADDKKVKRPDMNDVVAQLTNLMSGAHKKKKKKKKLHLSDFTS